MPVSVLCLISKEEGYDLGGYVIGGLCPRRSSVLRQQIRRGYDLGGSVRGG